MKKENKYMATYFDNNDQYNQFTYYSKHRKNTQKHLEDLKHALNRAYGSKAFSRIDLSSLIIQREI